MPHFWNNVLVVTKDELVPRWYKTVNTLKSNLRRFSDKPYGIKRVSRGGNGRQLLIAFDSLEQEIQKGLGRPEKEVFTTNNELVKYYVKDCKAVDFFTTYKKADGQSLDKKFIESYVANASVLNAVIAINAKRRSYRKALGGVAKTFWEQIAQDVEELREKTGHTLKTTALRKLISRYKKESYNCLINRRLGNQNTAKVVTENHLVILEELFKKHTNLDNEQVKLLYNTAATRIGWKSISVGTVANYRKKLDLYTYAGRRGETNYKNSRAMQVKRSAPNQPMVYWSVDGWDVELLYQKTEINDKGFSRTTYHNRLTAVVVLDPCLSYPIGYAIGTHETPELIKEALRNAANHTAELFGGRYKSLQLQSDHYGAGKLTPTYEAMTKHYTPARVKNAKTKRVEREFLEYNKNLQLYCPNWSGFGVTAKKENQPNADYLNKIRQQFPDEEGCRKQIVQLINLKRLAKREEYVKRWNQMPEADRLPLSHEEYLNLFGVHSGFTNKLEPSGLHPTINGEKVTFDSFDLKLREQRSANWLIKYDPADLSKALAVNAVSRNGKLIEEIGTVKIMLEAKYIQPMALYNRRDGDANELQRVNEYNKQLEQTIINRGISNREKLENLFANNPQLNDTLTKLVLADNTGQHKDNKNASRLLQQCKNLEIKQARKAEKNQAAQFLAMREAYINDKININDFLNL